MMNLSGPHSEKLALLQEMQEKLNERKLVLGNQEGQHSFLKDRIVLYLNMTEIIRAEIEHIDELAELFNSYRVFYEQDSNVDLAKNFIKSRMENNESTIFVSQNPNDELIGFVQLYSSFCSVYLCPILILYDLFVKREVRGNGHGRALMNKATEFAKSEGYDRLELSTATDNFIGQSLYESLGYERDNDFYHYSLEVDNED
tara:strand:- start:449 stop:1051 length:603 start_codon:yes stop_codon:yes gene_type:complete